MINMEHHYNKSLRGDHNEVLYNEAYGENLRTRREKILKLREKLSDYIFRFVDNENNKEGKILNIKDFK